MPRRPALVSSSAWEKANTSANSETRATSSEVYTGLQIPGNAIWKGSSTDSAPARHLLNRRCMEQSENVTFGSESPAKTEKAKLPPWAHVACGWPLVMVAFGGAIGGGLGAGAY